MPKIHERHAALCRLLEEHAHRYFVLDAPSVTDAEYDSLYRELLELERAHPELVTPRSPTQRVGATPREGFAKVEHTVRMQSLDNAYSESDVREFDRRVADLLPKGKRATYVVEPKIDGASVEVVYRDGDLALASTRGDGLVGEDITSNVRTIRGVPLTIADRRIHTLRGEVLIHRKDLEAINEQREALGEEPFANPRNAAAGSLRLVDARATAERPLRILFYDLVEEYFEWHHDLLSGLCNLGLPTHRRDEQCENIDGVLRFIDDFATERALLPYETDGVVVKVDELALRGLLGSTARFPRWATAFKYPAERVETVVRSIDAEVGRTGALTPVATLEPVLVSGTTVTHASLHNLDYIVEKDVRVGDTVIIEKAGEIIPQVVEVRRSERPKGTHPWAAPTVCPSCGTPVRREEGNAALRCPNDGCAGRLRAALFHFSRRGAMDISHLGHSLIEQLVTTGLVKDLADLFALREHRAELIALDRMAEKSVDNVLASVDTARTGRTLSRLLTGLGIPLVGVVAARLIAKKYGDLAAMLDLDPAIVRSDLGDIHGIGPKIADSVADFLAAPAPRAVMKRMLALGVSTAEPREVRHSGGVLEGLSFCVTGVLSTPREKIHARIREASGEVHDRVRKGTTYLVAGDKVGKSKLDAAKKHGTHVIDEAGLDALLNAVSTGQALE